MIQTMLLKFGRAPGTHPEPIPATPVTVFVGPNNSGKSKVLSEITRFCATGQKSTTDLILDDILFGAISIEAAKRKREKFQLIARANVTVAPNHAIFGKRGHRQNLPTLAMEGFLREPQSNLPAYCDWYLRHHVLSLNGRNRSDLVAVQNAGNLQEDANSSFQIIFRNDGLRDEVRRVLHDAFGEYLVVDPTDIGKLHLRLSKRAPLNPLEERGLHQEAVDFHRAAKPIEQTSDGVRAFVGMIIETLAGDPEVLLIDEPEAFLHPALAFSLGKELSRITQGSEKRLFVSTHSAAFVMGCVQSGAPVNIVRLTYRNEVATARLLPNVELLTLMRNPLLRSTRVIDGLFYELVVVTESDADRAFYQEANERLLRYTPNNGIPNCLFLNAQNKQTVQTILRPLRSLGIPAAGIVDIDVLKEGGVVWTSLLQSLSVPELEQNPLGTLRGSIKARLDATGKDMKREGGISLLSNGDAEAAQSLLSKLAEYGLFVVPHGELESWLPQLNVGGHGPNWLIQVFEKMGENPDIADYLKPTDGDVWAFLGLLKVWLANPSRKGIPQ